MKKTIAAILCLALSTGLYGCSESKESGNTKAPPNQVTQAKAESSQNTTTPIRADKTIPALAKQPFIINETPAMYTYVDMENDIEKLQAICGPMIRVEKLCDTADGRVVHDIILGNPNGDNQILIFGAMHAREYITTQVVMRQLLSAIDAKNGYGRTYKGIPLDELLRDVTIHFVPMNNPDGVTISQLGPAGLKREEIRSRVASMLDDEPAQWKANAVGVDLNRNFDAGWQEFVGSPGPSMERFKGAYPGSEPEAAALIRLTQDAHIKCSISYHTCGALIYWYYKQEGDVLRRSQDFAQCISDATGYPLDDDYTAVDAAGYKDWAVYKLGIPSITIEVGAENGGEIDNPVPMSQWNGIWDRNKDAVFAAAYYLKK